MARQIGSLPVILAPDGFHPLAFRWHGRMVRVLSVESVHTFGAERRYGARTVLGDFELVRYADSGAWLVRRGPSWLSRICSYWRDSPRYPLPSWRRRTRSAATAAGCVGAGGDHGDGFAVVR